MGMDEVTRERVKRTKNHPFKNLHKRHIKEESVKCPEENFNRKKTRNVAIKRA